MGKGKIRFLILPVTILVMGLAVWGPETLARYKDKAILNRITVEEVETGMEGYRYSLSSNEKIYLLSKCLSSQNQPESEQNALKGNSSDEMGYQELTGTYAFVINHKEGDGQEISDGEIFETCNEGLEALKELGILPDTVKEIEPSAYSAVLYSAIDVPEPRNNVLVWKVSLATGKQNANKENRLLDAYIDADTGKVYEFYVRTPLSWEDIDPDDIIAKWSSYLGLGDPESYDSVNPLAETTPYFKKYRFPGMEDGYTVVTIGFYEGINELFLKISK